MMLTDEQIAQLDVVEQTCFHGSWTKEMLIEELINPLSVLTVRERGGNIVGFALGRVVADEGELYQIAVLPEYRREHLGTELLTELHSLMCGRGAESCFLEVRSKNAPARALYERMGYEMISTRKSYYPDDDAAIYKIVLTT